MPHGHIDENGNYVVYLMAPGGNGDEMQAQLLVSSDGTSLIYYIASNAGGLIASDEFKRPTAARNDSLPSELWGNYIYDSGPERNGTLTVDAFRIDDNTYFNARQENGVWVVETGNGIEGWNERLSLLPDGRLSIQGDYSTEPTYYVRVSASGQSAGKEPVPDNPSLDLSRLPQIPSEDTDLFSVCFWTDAYSENGFDGVALMGDNSVTVDTLFAALFDSYSWDDSYMIQQGTEATVYDAVCELDGSQVRLRFSQLYSADIHISEGTIYKADGTIQSLSQYDIACLMSAVDSEYHSRNGSQPYSLARSLRGTWVSDDGQTELTIDGKTYGGDSYTISAVDENLGELYVTIARSDGTTDERWIEIMGDSMTVYTATKEDLLGNWVVDYSGEIFEITPYELGGTEYQITRIEGNTIHFVTPDGWYTSGTATLSEGGSKIHVYLSHFNGNTSWDGRREHTERLPIVNG